MKTFSIKKKLFKSLQIRILAVIFVFLFVPIAVLINYDFNQMETVLRENTSNLVLGNLEQIGNKIDNVTEDIMKISSMVSSNSVVVSSLAPFGYKDIADFKTKNLLTLGADDVIKIADIQKQIYYVKNNFFNYNMHVILFGADGNIYSSLDSVYDEWDFKLKYYNKFKDQEWYDILRKGKESGIWTAPFSYDIGQHNQRYLSLARTMKDAHTQNILGIIMVNFSEDNFKQYLGSGVNGGITLLNKDKQVIFSSDSKETENNLFQGPVYSKIPDRSKGFLSTKIEKNKYLVNYYNLQKIGWSLVSVIPYEHVMKEISSLRARTFTINIFLFAFFFIIALGLILYMLYPFKKLITKIRSMKIGEHSIGTDTQYSDDVSGIVNSFEYLVKRVEELVQRVIEEQKYESDLKYEALRAQINPHFLLNTLNIIKWSALMSGSENVSKMISALGKLLEVSMNKGEDEIALKEELELADSYLYIQNIRYNDKFRLTYEIGEPLSSCKILKLILQPIVENSIIHGFRNKAGDGSIVIYAEKKDDKLVVSVKDNGVGISSEKINQILDTNYDLAREKYSSIGLINIHERLRTKYGDSYGLRIDSAEGIGTTVSVVLPLIIDTMEFGG